MQVELFPPQPTRTIRFRHYGLVRVGAGTRRTPQNDPEQEPDEGTLMRTVLDYYRECRTRGSTDEEGQRALHIPGDTWRPRRHDLLNRGLVVPMGTARRTASGKYATVYGATEYGENL